MTELPLLQWANFFEGNISEGREQITVFNIPFEVLCGLATTILGHKCVPVTSHIPCNARLDYGGEKLPCIGSKARKALLTWTRISLKLTKFPDKMRPLSSSALFH